MAWSDIFVYAYAGCMLLVSCLCFGVIAFDGLKYHFHEAHPDGL